MLVICFQSLALSPEMTMRLRGESIVVDSTSCWFCWDNFCLSFVPLFSSDLGEKFNCSLAVKNGKFGFEMFYLILLAPCL